MITSTSELAAELAALRSQPVEDVLDALHGQLGEYAHASLAPQLRASLVELIRTALPGQAARAARGYYADRPVPLAAREREMLDRVFAVYGALEEQYRLCFEGFERGPLALRRQQDMAGAMQRAIHTVVSRMIEGYRARQVQGPTLWDALNRLVTQAHAADLGKIGVADELNPNLLSSVDTSYGRAILLAAAQAGAMKPRDLDASLALTALLEPFIDCVSQPTADGDSSQSVTRAGRLRVLNAAGMTHLLNNARLSGALQSLSRKLAEGEPIASLDVLQLTRRDFAGLLARLQMAWCEAGEIRADDREPTHERAAIVSGDQAIYRLLSGTDFVVPGRFQVDTRGAPPAGQEATLPVAGSDSSVAASWRVLDRSPGGLRARRSADGDRLTRGMLMGIRTGASPRSAKIFLGEIRWVQEEQDAGLFVGVKIQPGEALPMVGRMAGSPDGKQEPVIAPVFLLEQSASPKLVVPHGWWRPERVIEVFHDGFVLRFCMADMMLRGTDFEMGRFARLP